MNCDHCGQRLGRPDDQLITVQDVHNVVKEHLGALDKLWPEGERYGPRKVHIIELIDGIKLRLIQRAQRNEKYYESPFQKAAQKIAGVSEKKIAPDQDDRPAYQDASMQQAYEAAKARIAANKGRS